MSFDEGALAFVIVVAVIAAVICGIAWKVAYEDGREDGQLHERNLRSERRIRENRGEREVWGEHYQPDDFEQWIGELADAGEKRLADTSEMRQLADYHPARGRLIDTASFRALTDDWITQMTAEEAAFRKGLAS